MTASTPRGQAGPAGARCRILALAPNPWAGQWMNRQQVLSRLARHHAIVYSTGAWSVWDRAKPARRESPAMGGFEPRDGVVVDRPPRWLLRWPARPAYDRAILALLQRRWRRQLGPRDGGPLVAYLFHPRYLDYLDGLAPDRVVYQPYDLFRHMPGWSPDAADREARLLATCDAVIATSEATRRVLAAETARPVHLVPNGVDGDLFLRAAEDGAPDPLAGIPRPRIGYVGSLNQKVDLPLVATLARQEPGWQFVLVGPRGTFDEVTERALAECERLPNVHIRPALPHGDLPACMRGLDVALMCYRPGTWMEAAYPLKLHEYLASGPPVVSTDLPSVREFANVVAIAREPGDWRRLIASALRDGTPGTPAERRAVAAANTWDERVRIIDGILASLVMEPPAR